MKLLDKIKAKSLKVPYEVEDLWLAGTCISKTQYNGTGRAVIMPYFINHEYVEYSVGDIVPLFRLKTGKVFYKITDWKKYGGGDPASFDDQRQYDLTFHHLGEL